ncbi:ATP-binding protein [Mucilaginibacter sp. CSA2-8R]|uniref:ATP-binding protein n=1 Tax=Mucilaginibacter sp. CSA2-8R TaxID=3141542 RepID=UPI00315C88E3
MEFRQQESTEQFLSGGGEMGKLIRTMDWSNTALGPIESWPQSLRTSVSLCLSSTFPILIAWGPETIQIYNDSYRPICGAKHPESMGQNFRICWETALPVVGDKFDRGQHGEGTYIKDQRMFLDRYGYLEESFMTFSFAPIRDESGGVGGIFHPITETTDKMLSARRTQVLRDLGAAIGKAKSVHEIGEITQGHYNDYVLDLPFLLFYEMKDGSAELISSAGIPINSTLTPASIPLDGDAAWPLYKVMQTREILEVDNLQQRFGPFSCEPYELPPHTAVILPLHISGQAEPMGFMIAGVSACRALDNEYLNFYNLLATTYNTAVTNVYAYEQEQKRAEALAAIDRSKTAFFSNVSHEFRTPLTLMLGPLEDMLSKNNAEFAEPLEAVQRNALRLLKLVNNLLDYSRVEAGRAQAAYQLTNLCELTTDLASSFRSIIEKAGMKLEVNCSEDKGNIFVDRQMWEKIVLNLLSNAFKYTLEGTISIMQHQENNQVVLQVKDTGVGIPAKELPHMFERFHRIENSAGRTHEGTGIGLSLVHELVNLHSGHITVDSVEGEGSVFTVTIPVGYAHLPAERLVDGEKKTDTSALKGAFLQEAISLLQTDTNTDAHDSLASQNFNSNVSVPADAEKDVEVLVVDDNADMRAYLARLLEPYFSVITATDGQDALSKLNNNLPALVISDIMMPVMDGKAMLRQIRSTQRTARLPVIFLSARAGEEARIDGLEAGADDYLVKPFSAAELLTKIRAQINISKARQHAEEQLRNLFIQAPVAIAIYYGPQFIVELANEKMLEYWGLDESAILYQPLLEILPQLKAAGFDDVMQHIYKTGERHIASQVPLHLNRNAQTETVYINLTMEALRDQHGIISGIVAVAAEVTEQVIARKDAEKANATLKLAMNAAGMGIWRNETGSDVLEVSEKARDIHGLPHGTALSFSSTQQLILPEYYDPLMSSIRSAIENKSSFNEDYQIQPVGTQNIRWINSVGQVEVDNDGDVKAIVGTIIDITETKEDELRKNDFISMVSHELKTPLTSLMAYAQLLSRNADKTNDTFAQKNLIKTQQQIRKMTSLINGFLNVSRLESGKIHLQKTTFSFNDMVREMVDDARLYSSQHQLELHQQANLTLHADRDKIGVVVTNLLSNAIKYSAANTTVTAIVTEANGAAILSVQDQGMGIKPQDQAKLFDRYYRVNDTKTQNISGFGIGLYLSKEIIKRHGGEMWVESEHGVGSTFYFKLPLETSAMIAAV